MAYNPSMYLPQYNGFDMQNQNWMYQTHATQPINGLVRVSGYEGAQLYQLPPNSVSPPLFLENENSFFVKTTDGGGAATIKKYSFKEEPVAPAHSQDYVTKEDFDSFVQEIRGVINGQYSVQKPESAE